MGNNTSIQLTDKKEGILKNGSVILYKHPFFKGESSILKSRSSIYTAIDLYNNGIEEKTCSSIILGPLTKITLYDNSNNYIILENNTSTLNYYYEDLRKRTNEFATWNWDNIISSIRIEDIILIDNTKINYILINYIDENNEKNQLNFSKGIYNNLWLNSNKYTLNINILQPNTSIILHTNNIANSSSKKIITIKQNTILSNIGIIRSINIL
jgi:hypothetical protein